MKTLFLFGCICLLVLGCKRHPKEVIKLSQKVVIEYVDDLGQGKYEVYFSYRWKDGHMIGTGVLVNEPMNVGDTKTYVEYEKEDEYGSMIPHEELRN